MMNSPRLPVPIVRFVGVGARMATAATARKVHAAAAGGGAGAAIGLVLASLVGEAFALDPEAEAALALLLDVLLTAGLAALGAHLAGRAVRPAPTDQVVPEAEGVV